MRTTLQFTILICLSCNLFGQNIDEQRYRNDLKNAQSTQDTIAAWSVYKNLSTDSESKAENLLKETLQKAYPAWTEIEGLIVRRDSNLTILKLQHFVETTKNPVLKNYGLTMLRIKELKGQLKKTVDNSIIKEDLSKPKDLIFAYYLKYMQHLVLNQEDSLVLCMKKVTEGIDEQTYSGLQLAVITNTLNVLFTRINDETSIYLDKGIRISESLNEYNNRSVLYNARMAYLKSKGDLEEAMKSAIKFIEINELVNNYHRTIIGYLNLASFNQEQGRFEEAYKLIFKARDLAEEKNDDKTIAMTLNSEAFLKMNDKKYEEAIRILKKSKKIKHENIGAKFLTEVNLIESYYCISELDSAYLVFKELEAIDPKNNYGHLNYAKAFVSKYLVEQKEYVRAQEYINAAMKDAIAYQDMNSKSVALLAQAELDEALGNYKKAIENYRTHFALEHDFRNEDLASEITKLGLEKDFEIEKEVLALTNEKEKLKITNERNNAIFLGCLALLAALSALGFYLFMRRKNKEIERQNKKLESLNNVKDTLFQIIGHDLKKPTINFRNVSKNISYLLEKKDYNRLQLLGEEVDQDAKSLYNLTDNLLNWALMQKDTISIRPEKVNLYEIVNYNFELFANLSKRKGITIENQVDKEVYTLVDRNSLDTIIRNLIDNAIKYTPRDGLVSLSCKVTDDQVRVIISDNGVGMDQAEIDQINTSESVASKKGTLGESGSGIGLQLIKRLIKKNNGNLGIKSESGVGSTISVDLPIAA